MSRRDWSDGGQKPEKVNAEFKRICEEESDAGETVVVAQASPYEPTTDLGKMLLVIVQAVGGLEPQAFVKVNVENALKQADGLKSGAR